MRFFLWGGWGRIDLEKDIKDLSGELEVLYFDRSMFYTGISICQNLSSIHKIYASQSISILPQKRNIELWLVGLFFLDGIGLSILKLPTLYSSIEQMSKYIEGARFLTSG